VRTQAANMQSALERVKAFAQKGVEILRAKPRDAKGRLFVWTARGILLAGAAIFFLPAEFFATPGFGLEPSWQITMNKAFSDGWIAGQRIIFEYGPLGFLEYRYPYGVSAIFYAGFDMLALLVFLRFTADVARLRLDKYLVAAGFALLFLSKQIVSTQPSATLFCLMVYLTLRNVRIPGFTASVALVLCSVVAFFGKMNFGLMGIFLCGLVFVFKAVDRQKSAWFWLVIIASQVLLVVLLAPRLHANFAAYLRSSLEIISQYSDGFSHGPRRGSVEYLAVCLLFAAFLIRSALLVRTGLAARESWLVLLMGGAAAFILFKASIVRSDYLHHEHFLFCFPVIGLAFIAHAPEELKRMWRPLVLSSTLYASLLLIARDGNCLAFMDKASMKAFLPVDYVRGLREFNQHANWKDYVDFVREKYPERSLPDNVIQLVGTNSVDVFPHEATLAYASGLNYQPLPITQSFQALGKLQEARAKCGVSPIQPGSPFPFVCPGCVRGQHRPPVFPLGRAGRETSFTGAIRGRDGFHQLGGRPGKHRPSKKPNFVVGTRRRRPAPTGHLGNEDRARGRGIQPARIQRRTLRGNQNEEDPPGQTGQLFLPGRACQRAVPSGRRQPKGVPGDPGQP
jgi:hypothetical protein